METIPSKYAGQSIALVNEKVVVVAKNSLEAYQKAKKMYPHDLIALMRVPRKKELVTFL